MRATRIICSGSGISLKDRIYGYSRIRWCKVKKMRDEEGRYGAIYG